jgi:hypothetical protein
MHNEVPSHIPCHMKGRVLSFENLTVLCGTDGALTIAWAFKRGALSHSLIVPLRPRRLTLPGIAKCRSNQATAVN